MTQDNNAVLNDSSKRISSGELNQLLANPPKEIIAYSGEESTIVIDGYTIEDENIIFDETLIIKLRLKFQNCNFKSEYSIWVDGIVCNDYVTFEGCSFSGGIHFRTGIF